MKLVHSRSLFLALGLLAIFCGFSSSTLHAQGNIRITHTQEKDNIKDGHYLGRDLWFCIPTNYDPNKSSDKYFQVYVTAYRNTTVHFQVGNDPIVNKPVTANQVTIFSSPTSKTPSGDIKLSTEMKSSGVVEPKGVHVWSDNADISVYFLSRVPYTSDGSYIIPTTGWGKEYVVGAYESINDPTGGADWPSEFAIVSNQNGTTVTITPACDLRKDGNRSFPEHPAGQTFTVNLNRGECVQFQATLPTSAPPNVTGTYINSNNPVGVMGGSVCPYITFPNGYCDYVLDMLQPIRTWSKSYFTCPFAGRKYGGDVYLVIGSKNGQRILRNGAQVALVDRFTFYYIEDEVAPSTPSLWESADSSAFDLIQFVPSAKFGAPAAGTTRNQGDPAMVVVNSIDQYSKKIIFQTPKINLASGQTQFTNYVNIILPKSSDSAKTLYDGFPLSLKTNIPNVQVKERFNIGATGWICYRLTYKQTAGDGKHQVTSDTGVGVYIYGYGTDDSYAWSGALGTKTVNDPDTIPPIAIPGGPCFNARVDFTDQGVGQSTLSSYGPDSVENIDFEADTSFIAGANLEHSYYNMHILDSGKDAYLSVSIYDVAGNRTTVTSIYKAVTAKMYPNPISFGTVLVGSTGFKYDTICNIGEAPFHFDKANLKFKTPDSAIAHGFSIDSVVSGDIPVGGCRIVKLKFLSNRPPTVTDTLILNDECSGISSVVKGNGGEPSFDLGGYAFDCTILNSNRASVGYNITDPTETPVQIDSIWLEGSGAFTYDKASPATNKFPFIIPGSSILGTYGIEVKFNPPTKGSYFTVIHALNIDKQTGKRTIKSDTIWGIGCAPDVIPSPGTTLTDCGVPVSVKVPITNRIDSIYTISDVIGSVGGVTSASGFANKFDLEDASGTLITVFPDSIKPGETVFASVFYTPPPQASGCFVDTLVIKRPDGSRIGVAALTVCAQYRDFVVSKNNVDLGSVPFNSGLIQNFFTICNDGGDTATIKDITQLSDPTKSAFHFVPAKNKALPVNIAPGQCLDVWVSFDPSNSSNPTQLDSFAISSNSCNITENAVVQAEVTLGGNQLAGFTQPAIFSCDSKTNNAVFNDAVGGTIDSIVITGPDKANFNVTLTPAPPIAVAAKTPLNIPISFSPSPEVPARTYNAVVVVYFTNAAGIHSTSSAPITAIAQGWNMTVTSKPTNPVASAGTFVDIPVQIDLDKHALVAPTVSYLNINRVELTYSYNQNILDLEKGDFNKAVTFPAGSTWSLDLAASKLDVAAQTLLIVLKNSSVLTEAELGKKLATISLKASLPVAGVSTQVLLTDSKIITTSNVTISSCTDVARKDSTFSLVYLCGDSTLQRWMNGQIPIRAYPVSPNPAGNSAGSVLDFKYTSRIIGNVSLSIYDELGREVAKVLNDQYIPAGTYEVRFDGSKLGEGTYVYRYSLNKRYVSSGRFIIQK
ncbi:MAG: IgGFc-binding protein [bacterium]